MYTQLQFGTQKSLLVKEDSSHIWERLLEAKFHSSVQGILAKDASVLIQHDNASKAKNQFFYSLLPSFFLFGFMNSSILMVVNAHALERGHVSQLQVMRLDAHFQGEFYIEFLLDVALELLDSLGDQRLHQGDVSLETSNIHLVLEDFEEGLFGVKNGQRWVPGQ